MIEEAGLDAQNVLIDVRNGADATIYGIKQSLSKDKILAEVSSEIEFTEADLMKAMAKDDQKEIKRMIDAENKAVSKIREHTSSRAGGSASGASQGGDQTHEAEYFLGYKACRIAGLYVDLSVKLQLPWNFMEIFC